LLATQEIDDMHEFVARIGVRAGKIRTQISQATSKMGGWFVSPKEGNEKR